MIGIDHSTAGVKIREQFAFTASKAGRAMEAILRQPDADIQGCVLLSTCNRTELYVSVKESAKKTAPNLPALLQNAGQFPVPVTEYASCFTIRKAKEAAKHLFYLTAGLKSRIVGEDQILTQVKDALEKSRQLYCTDTLLEVLFRHAITAAKKVKAKTQFGHADCTAVHCAVAFLKQQGYRFAGKKCLVIGNGRMGKTAAEALRDAGASVTVTVRQYRSGIVEIPKGCARIHYGERYGLLAECDLIISATVSPNLTIQKEPLAQARGSRKKQQVFIDLAVPRDMEEGIAELDGVELYNIDAFQSDVLPKISGTNDTAMQIAGAGDVAAQIAETSDGATQVSGTNDVVSQISGPKDIAEKILEQRLLEFQAWYGCRDLVPRIQQIGSMAADEICWRMGRGLGQVPQQERETINGMLHESARKVIDKMLFTLRDGLPQEELHRCIEALEGMEY